MNVAEADQLDSAFDTLWGFLGEPVVEEEPLALLMPQLLRFCDENNLRMVDLAAAALICALGRAGFLDDIPE